MFGEQIISEGIKAVAKFIPDADARNKFELDLATLEARIIESQNKVNEIEAANPNLFVSGWRPAAGWTCVGGLGYQIILRPVLGWFMSNTYDWTLPPSLEVDTLMTLLFGLLGLGGYRTFEKIQRVAR